MVRRGFLTLILLVGLPMPAMADVRYESDALGFEVRFPVEPVAREATLNAPSGPVELVRFQARAPGLRAALNVARFSRAAFTPQEVAAGLDQSLKRQIAAVKGTLVSSTDLDLGGVRGREGIIAFGPPERNFRYRVRAYYVENRQYLISVIGTAADVSGERAEAFFSSFAFR